MKQNGLHHECMGAFLPSKFRMDKNYSESTSVVSIVINRNTVQIFNVLPGLEIQPSLNERFRGQQFWQRRVGQQLLFIEDRARADVILGDL
jgi:hypothetical protein